MSVAYLTLSALVGLFTDICLAIVLKLLYTSLWFDKGTVFIFFQKGFRVLTVSSL